MVARKNKVVDAPATHVREMLAFDIETTGLDFDTCVVTVVCTEDFHTGQRHAYEFARVRACEPQNEALLRDELVRAFDEADSLCAFNGVRFDIPFLHKALQLSQETSAAWLFKTTDILEASRLGLFGPAHTFGLNLLCQHNQVAVKSGSGLQAIKFANECRWDELLRYCADDVRILCDLYRRRLLNNPRFHTVIDLSLIAPASTYATSTYATSTCAGAAVEKIQESHKSARTADLELVDLRRRLEFYQEHVFGSPDAEATLARLLTANAQQQLEIQELKKKLEVYHELCVCLD
jgi:hypothetical protein